MPNDRFMVDNNTLTHLGISGCSSNFFRQHVRIPELVLREATGRPDYHELRALEYPTTHSVIELVVSIMNSLPVDQFKLVDLYSNKGAADPFILACTIDAILCTTRTLFPDHWTLVTDDHAVRQVAAQHQVETMSNRDFCDIIADNVKANIPTV